MGDLQVEGRAEEATELAELQAGLGVVGVAGLLDLDVAVVDGRRICRGLHAAPAQEKRGRGFRNTPKTLKTFEKVEDEGGVDLKVLEGRYGPYVTDGKVNASLPKDSGDPTQLTLADARDLLARQREKKATKG